MSLKAAGSRQVLSACNQMQPNLLSSSVACRLLTSKKILANITRSNLLESVLLKVVLVLVRLLLARCARTKRVLHQLTGRVNQVGVHLQVMESISKVASW